MRIYRTDRFTLPLPDGHRFPVRKYALLAETVADFAAMQMEEAPAATRAELTLAHAPQYVNAIFDGTLSHTALREIGFPWSPELAERSARSVGATIAAARSALWEDAGVNLAGGTHHANTHKGGGFCVFNDVAVAARQMQQEGLVRRALVIDLDVHQGNGTAEIFSDDASVFTFSMHGAKNFPFRKVSSDWDIELPDLTEDAAYLDQLDSALPKLFAQARPDLVFYLAGADSYTGDRLGRLALSKAGLLERDLRVMNACRQHGVALAVSMAGGYAEPIEDTVAIQAATVRCAYEIFRSYPISGDIHV